MGGGRGFSAVLGLEVALEALTACSLCARACWSGERREESGCQGVVGTKSPTLPVEPRGPLELGSHSRAGPMERTAPAGACRAGSRVIPCPSRPQGEQSQGVDTVSPRSTIRGPRRQDTGGIGVGVGSLPGRLPSRGGSTWPHEGPELVSGLILQTTWCEQGPVQAWSLGDQGKQWDGRGRGELGWTPWRPGALEEGDGAAGPTPACFVTNRWEGGPRLVPRSLQGTHVWLEGGDSVAGLKARFGLPGL